MALLKRLKKSKGWLHALCVRLFEEQGLAVIPGGAFQVRAVDATTVKEPGPSGSLWRLHYSVGLPSRRALFQADGDRGAGHGRIVGAVPDPRRRPCAGRTRLFDGPGHSPRGRRGRAADCACHGVAAAVHDGRAAVRPACGGGVGHASGRRPVLRRSRSRSRATMAARPARLRAGSACSASAEAIRLAHQKVRRDAARKGNQVQPATLRFAEYAVFTTFPEPPFSAADVLEWYRLRWQVELVFKRFKSLAQLGHVPSTTTTAPRRGSTGNCSWRCWWRS